MVASARRDGKRHGPPDDPNRRGACGGLAERNERRQPPARASAATYFGKSVSMCHLSSALRFTSTKRAQDCSIRNAPTCARAAKQRTISSRVTASAKRGRAE
jgi:hypothetical protein